MEQNQVWIPSISRLFPDPVLESTNLKSGNRFLARNAKKPGVITLPDGLEYRVITSHPTGPTPTDSSTVMVNYSGTFIDGTVLDSSASHGGPTRLWAAICDGRPCWASGTRYASPILAADFADLLWKAQARGLRGKYNLAGAERASMWQLATALAAAAGLPLRVMRFDPNSISDDSAGQETSLDSRRAQRALETSLPRLSDGIDRFVELAASGYRDRIAAALALPTLASSAA